MATNPQRMTLKVMPRPLPQYSRDHKHAAVAAARDTGFDNWHFVRMIKSGAKIMLEGCLEVTKNIIQAIVSLIPEPIREFTWRVTSSIWGGVKWVASIPGRIASSLWGGVTKAVQFVVPKRLREWSWNWIGQYIDKFIVNPISQFVGGVVSRANPVNFLEAPRESFVVIAGLRALYYFVRYGRLSAPTSDVLDHPDGPHSYPRSFKAVGELLETRDLGTDILFSYAGYRIGQRLMDGVLKLAPNEVAGPVKMTFRAAATLLQYGSTAVTVYQAYQVLEEVAGRTRHYFQPMGGKGSKP